MICYDFELQMQEVVKVYGVVCIFDFYLYRKVYLLIVLFIYGIMMFWKVLLGYNEFINEIVKFLGKIKYGWDCEGL